MQPRHTRIECGREIGGALHDPRHVPHRPARRSGVDVAEAGDERHDQLGLLDGGEHTRDGADADAGRTGHEDVPAEEPPVQREEAAGVVDDLLVGELTEVWAARDQSIDLVTVCSQLGQVVAGEEVVEVALELRGELFVLVVGTGLVLVRRDARHVAEVLEVDHLRRQAGHPRRRRCASSTC